MKPIALVTAKVRLRNSVERQDRLRRPALDERERDERDDAEREPARCICDEPHGPRRPAEAREQHDRRQAAGEQRRARVVDPVLDVRGAGVERDRDHHQRERAERQVDVEDPAPREVVDEEAAEQRADHGRDAEDSAEEALVLAPLARRDDVADDGHRRHDQAAAADPLEGAERDQLAHVLREPAQRRADQEDDDRRLQDDPAAVQVAELPVHRPDDGRGEQVRGDDPGQMLDPAEIADDRRQRGRDDRLVERGQQQDQHQRAEDQPRRAGRPAGRSRPALRLNVLAARARFLARLPREATPPEVANDGQHDDHEDDDPENGHEILPVEEYGLYGERPVTAT